MIPTYHTRQEYSIIYVEKEQEKEEKVIDVKDTYAPLWAAAV